MFNKNIFLIFSILFFLSVPKAWSFKDPVQYKINSVDYDLDVRNVKVIKKIGNFLHVGTPEGFYKYNIEKEDLEYFDYNNGLISRSIFSITEDPDKKRIWLGTYGGGLSRFVDKKINTYNVPQGLCDPFVYDVEFDEQGKMWIATWSGANRISGDIDKRENWERYTVENSNNGLSDNWVYSIEIGEKGEVWFGTENGFSLFDGTKWKKWRHENGLGAELKDVKEDNEKVMSPLQGSHHASQLSGLGPATGGGENYNPNYILSMKVGPDKNVWLGTWGGGLVKFDPKKETFTNYTVKDGLPGNYILTIEFDKKGVMWIGSNNGLTKYDGNKFVNYDEKDGLFSQFIFTIAFSEDDSMWLGGWRGVSHVLSIAD